MLKLTSFISFILLFSTVAFGQVFEISPLSLEFGTVAIGSTSTLQSTISNTGTSDLVITNITSSDGQFTFIPNTFPVTIAAGDSQSVDVTFTPTITGLTAGQLTITHNASGSPTTYPVQGNGIDAISSSINLLNLINVITGSVVDTQIILTNNGISPLLVNANLTNAINWSITPDTALIPAGGNLLFMLTFTAPSIQNTYTDTLIFSSPGITSLSVPLSATVVTDAGLIFEKDSVYRLEDNSFTEVMQLKSLTDYLHALQFRLQVNKEIDDNIILIFQNIQKGTDISDAGWILVYTVTRGPMQPNGASADEVFVVIYNNNQGVSLPPGDYNDLFKLNYKVADLAPLQDSLKSTFKVTNAEGSTYQGLPIDVTPSRDILTVFGRNRVTWRGDVNSDGFLDVLDLLMVVDHIVNKDSLNPTAFFRADIAPWLPGTPEPEPDGIVNVQELSLIQNIILTGFYPDGTPIGLFKTGEFLSFDGDEDAKVTFYINNDGIKAYVNAKKGIRGAQIEFTNVSDNPEDMIIDTDLGQGFFAYINESQILRALLYDPLGEKFLEPGEHLMADLPFKLTKPEEVSLEKIILVDVSREKVAKIQVDIVYGNPSATPTDYVLFQNYPNPFNPETNIEFFLPEDVGNANLSIYNSLGEKVDQLVNSSLTAGLHRYIWNGKNLASGIYMYQLITDKFNSVRKMVLVK